MARPYRPFHVGRSVLVAAAALALLFGTASAVPVAFEAGGTFFIPVTVDSVNITGQGLLPLGRISDPNNPNAVGFDFVQSQVTFTKNAATPTIPIGRHISLPANDPLLDPNNPNPFVADIQSGHALNFQDFLPFGLTVQVTDIDPLKNFAPSLTDPLTFNVFGALIATGSCVADTSLPNLGCQGPVPFDWGLSVNNPGIGDVDGNGSPNQFRLGPEDPNNPNAVTFFFTDGTVTFSSAPSTWTYEIVNDPNDPEFFPGRVNPPFTIGSLQGPITTTQQIVVPGPRQTSVPEPGTLTVIGVGAAGFGLALRFRVLRARLKDGKK